MASYRTKTFTVSDPHDLEKIDGWWAGLLRTGAKEITDIEWIARGDLTWMIKFTWTALADTELPFNVCMPAYSSLTTDVLQEIVDSVTYEKEVIEQNLTLFKAKIDDWGISEVEMPVQSDESHFTSDSDDYILDFSIDPGLSYASKLDVVDKIMVTEFLWPSYKSMKRGLLMCEARIEEIKQEIEHRGDPAYTVVHMDRGMLRKAFVEQMGYDNKWLFATDEELIDGQDTNAED